LPYSYPLAAVVTVAAAHEAVTAAAEQNDKDYDNPETTIAAKKAIVTHMWILLNFSSRYRAQSILFLLGKSVHKNCPEHLSSGQLCVSPRLSVDSYLIVIIENYLRNLRPSRCVQRQKSAV